MNTVKHKSFTISLIGTQNQANPVYISFKVSSDAGVDVFEMVIPLMEAMKYPNMTHEQYLEESVEAIKHYLDLRGIARNQTHIFDFDSSHFVPRESMNWP